jgi:hypothetical protein
MWIETDSDEGYVAQDQPYVEVGISRELGRNPYTGNVDRGTGFYWGRKFPGAPGSSSGYDEWALPGDVGPVGTWHKYNLRYEPANGGGWQVKIDDIYRATAGYNGPQSGEMETGLEVNPCFTGSTSNPSYTTISGTLQDRWLWWQSDRTTSHRPDFYMHSETQDGARSRWYPTYTSRDQSCATINSDDWCNDWP